MGPDVLWDGSGLTDAITGAVYPLNAEGRSIARCLVTPTSVGHLAQRLARQFAIEPAQAGADLRDFVQELHGHHLVSIHQSFWQEVPDRLRHSRFNPRALARLRPPVPVRYPSRSYEATPVRIAIASWEAHQPSVVIGLVCAVAAQAVYLPAAVWGVPSLDAAARLATTAALLLAAYVSAVVASAAVHELAHYATARLLGLRVSSVNVRMFTVGITHMAADPLKSWCVSATGPTVTVLALLGPTMVLVGLSGGSVARAGPAAWLLLFLAAQHGFALMPFAADGRRVMAGAIGLLLRSRSVRG